jgi:hypothetical protein
MPPLLLEHKFPALAYVDIDGESPRAGFGLAFRADEGSAAVNNAMKTARAAKLHVSQ